MKTSTSLSVIGGVACCFFAIAAAIAADKPAPDKADAQIKELIQKLSHKEWSVREKATEDLLKMGAPARDALVGVLNSNDLEAVERAQRILKQLPWGIAAEDPPSVLQMLKDFQELTEDRRAALPSKIAAAEPESGLPALLRIARYDLSEHVAFAAASAIIQLKDAKTVERVVAANLPSTRPALMWLLSWTQTEKKPAESVALLEKAIAGERKRLSSAVDLPAYDPRFFCEMLADLEKRPLDKARMAEIPKMWGNLSKPLPGHIEGVVRLFDALLQSNRAQQIVSTFQDVPEDLQKEMRLLYMTAKAHGMLNNTEQEKQVLDKALESSGKEASKHFAAAEFLLRRGWNEWGRAELEAVAQLGDQVSGYRSHYMLAGLNEQMGEMLRAADHLEKAMRIWFGPQDKPGDEGFAGMKLKTLSLRTAHYQKTGDTKKWEEMMGEYLKLRPTDPERVIHYYEWLQAQGRPQDAAACLDTVRATFENLAPNAHVLFDQLALIMARTGQRLDEAKQLSENALSFDPHNPDYLSTMAEVQFRQGQKQAAVDTVQRALKDAPGHQRLQEQLKRFQADAPSK